MSTSIRLTRRGRLNAPFYRIGVYDSRQRRDGAAIETLGFYNPLARGQEKALEVDVERLRHWLSVGAQPSETVQSFMKKEGVAWNPALKRRERNQKRAKKRTAAEKKSGKTHGRVKQRAEAGLKAERRSDRDARRKAAAPKAAAESTED